MKPFWEGIAHTGKANVIIFSKLSERVSYVDVPTSTEH